MYKRILVPLDGSYLAEIALPYMEEIACYLNSDVTLIRVAESEDDTYDHMHRVYIDKMVEVTRQNLQKFHEKIGGEPINVNSVFLAGNVAEEIVDYAENQQSGLIIMATHGRSGIRRWLLGSVASKVVSATEQPVLLIRAKKKDAIPKGHKKRLIKKILVPLDGSKVSEAVIPYIMELASRLKAEVTFFHVIAPVYFFYSIPGEAVNRSYSPEDMINLMTRNETYLDTVGVEFKDKGIKTKSKVVVGVPADEIIRTADETRADVVAMSTHGYSGINRWTLGSTADKVLHAGNTPLLLVRPH